MLRVVSALAKQACQASVSQSIAETCCRALGASQACSTALHRRPYSSIEPDPEVNPKPSKAVLDVIEAIENLTVRDLVWLNKLLQETLGISDAQLMGTPAGMPTGAPAASAAAAPAAAAPEPEKTEFKVVVESYEASTKIKIIKEVRSILPDLGLKDAKDLVDKIPATIKSGVTKAEAEELKKKLEAVGAKVKLD